MKEASDAGPRCELRAGDPRQNPCWSEGGQRAPQPPAPPIQPPLADGAEEARPRVKRKNSRQEQTGQTARPKRGSAA